MRQGRLIPIWDEHEAYPPQVFGGMFDKQEEEGQPEPNEGRPETLKQLLQLIKLTNLPQPHVVPSTDQSYELVVTPQGNLFINPRFNGTLVNNRLLAASKPLPNVKYVNMHTSI